MYTLSIHRQTDRQFSYSSLSKFNSAVYLPNKPTLVQRYFIWSDLCQKENLEKMLSQKQNVWLAKQYFVLWCKFLTFSICDNISFCSSSFCSFLSDHTFALTVSLVGALLAPSLVLFWFQLWHWPLSLQNRYKIN